MAQRGYWEIAGPAGLWEVALGEAQSSQANSPEVSAGFNTVREAPEWGHRHPTWAPLAHAKVNLPLTWPHGCFTSQQVGEASPPSTAAETPCPCSCLPVPGLVRLLLLIPRVRALQEATLHPTEREKNQVTKRVMGQLSAYCIWVV